MTHAIWKGHLAFGLVHLPIALFSAESRDELDFDLIDRRDGNRIGYAKVNKSTGKEVPPREIVKGFAVASGRYVVVTDADFKRAHVESTRTVDISEFVEAAAIDPMHFDQPYYVVPGKGGERPYRLLLATLRATGRIGIGRIVLRQREHVAALRPHDDALVLQTMRYAHELRTTKGLGLPAATKKPEPRELAMAKRLVEEMSGTWRPGVFKDRYRDALLAVIRRKAKAGGRELPPPAESEPERPAGKILDLAELLKKSVERRRSA